jgi:molecular chaperone DnaJ
MTHYDVLGVTPAASDSTIRAAFRDLARQHHPDRVATSSAAGGYRDMGVINEAYRVLRDPARRAIYDRAIQQGPVGASSTGSAVPSARQPTETENVTWEADSQVHYHHGPARVPWRMLLFLGLVATVGIVILAQFTGSGADLGPDGILRNGDCVEIEPDNDAREIRCSGSGDLVVRAFVPFDGNCPGFTEPHRDRQGMGVACIELPAED